MHWFRWQELQARKGEARARRMLTSLREVVTRFVPGFAGLRIEDKPVLRFVVEKNDTPLALDQLSDGERGLLAVIFDITRRLAIANPALDDPISDGKAIILLDEVELHLHPTWQRQVLRRLRNTFKRCQFIVTTHSPQVIGQVWPRCLHLLEHSEQDKRIVVHRTSQSFGMDSNWILQNIMGSLARDYDTEQRLSTAYDKIDAEDLGEARELLTVLEADVGLFPDLQEAKSLLDRLELLESDATD
jgi:predicted ATP-binding protein involved in virulence